MSDLTAELEKELRDGINGAPPSTVYMRFRPSAVEAVLDELSRLRKEVADLREALEPFSVIAGELFARNFNKADKVFSISGRAPEGYPVELSLTFEAFLNARRLAALTGDDNGN